MKCPKCGTSNLPATKYCESCSHLLIWPKAKSDASEPGLEFTSRQQFASFSRRTVAAVVDVILVSLVLSGLDWAMGALSEDGGAFHAINRYLTISFTFAFIFEITLYFGVLNLVYHIVMECSPWQATIGKSLLGITVTDMQGRRIDWMRSANRNLGKIVSAVILGFGFLVAIFHPQRQTLHDMMASCYVAH